VARAGPADRELTREDELTQWTAWADKVLVFQEARMFLHQRMAEGATLAGN
jgi:hypothetical protein